MKAQRFRITATQGLKIFVVLYACSPVLFAWLVIWGSHQFYFDSRAKAAMALVLGSVAVAGIGFWKWDAAWFDVERTGAIRFTGVRWYGKRDRASFTPGSLQAVVIRKVLSYDSLDRFEIEARRTDSQVDRLWQGRVAADWHGTAGELQRFTDATGIPVHFVVVDLPAGKPEAPWKI